MLETVAYKESKKEKRQKGTTRESCSSKNGTSMICISGSCTFEY